MCDLDSAMGLRRCINNAHFLWFFSIFMHTCSTPNLSLLAAQTCLTLCDHGDYSPPGSCPWDFPGKNTGVGCPFLFQGNLPGPRIQPVTPVSPSLQVVAATYLYTEKEGKCLRIYVPQGQPLNSGISASALFTLIGITQDVNYSWPLNIRILSFGGSLACRLFSVVNTTRLRDMQVGWIWGCRTGHIEEPLVWKTNDKLY